MIGYKYMIPITRPLQKAHSDLWGLYNPASIRSNCYFVIVINRKVWTYGAMTKKMFFLVFKIQKKGVKTKTWLKFSSLGMDGRGKYIGFALKKFCEKKRVVIEFTSSYTFEQNSITKQSWRTLNIMKDAMLANNKLLKEFWAKIMATAIYLKNLFPISSKEKVPEQL